VSLAEGLARVISEARQFLSESQRNVLFRSREINAPNFDNRGPQRLLLNKKSLLWTGGLAFDEVEEAQDQNEVSTLRDL